MGLCDVLTAFQEEKEFLLVFIDGGGTAQMRELAQWITAKRRPETPVDGVDELRPCWSALVLLESVIPLAGGGLQIERCRWHLEVVRRAVGTKELLGLVQPCDGIVGSVELRKSELVRRRGRGVAG